MKRQHRRGCWSIAALLMALGGVSAWAQEGEAGSESPATSITLEADDRAAGGKATFVQGTADSAGMRFHVEGVEVMQPITVAVYTQNTADDVRLQIVKDNWDKPEREARTGDSRIAELNFRTFDSFNIRVDAEQATEFQLAVWVGDELAIPAPSIAVPASEYTGPASVPTAASAAEPVEADEAEQGKSGGVSLSYLELGLIVALLVIVAAFAVVLLRRKPS